MNGNDLLSALSGLDPKYIDEAAYELHDVNAADSKTAEDTTGNVVGFSKRNHLRKFIYIALPSVAAILLIVGVALPAIMRVSKGDSAPAMESAAPASDASYAEEPVAEAAEEAVSEEAAYDNEADTQAVAEAPSAADESAEEATFKRDDKRTLTTETDSLSKSEETAKAEASETAGMANETPAMTDAAEEAAPMAESEAEEAVSEEAEDTEEAGMLIISNADYVNGILTLEISGMTPEEISQMTCNIEKTMSGKTVLTYKAGTVSNIMTETAPVTLDISKFKLTAGTYKVTIGSVGEAEFTVK